jgi:hypothetical protein
MKDLITIGMDLGDRKNQMVVLDAEGSEIEVRSIGNRKGEIVEFFKKYPGATVALEAGTHSGWVSRELEGLC